MSRQRAVIERTIVVEELVGMKVHEQNERGLGFEHRRGSASANGPAEPEQGVEPLGGFDHLSRAGKRGLLAAEQCLVPERFAIGRFEDRLEGHPEAVESAFEAHFEPHAVGRWPDPARDRKGLAS